METTTRVETQGDLLWSNNVPQGMMQVTFIDDTQTLGMYLTSSDAVAIFQHVLDHAKQLQADVEMLEGLSKAGVSRELIKQGTRLTMLKRQAGNG